MGKKFNFEKERWMSKVNTEGVINKKVNQFPDKHRIGSSNGLKTDLR